MKQKRKYTRICHEAAVSIVRGYHLDDRTQAEMAKEHGISTAYAGRVAHGDAHREAFLEVFPDQR